MILNAVDRTQDGTGVFEAGMKGKEMNEKILKDYMEINMFMGRKY